MTKADVIRILENAPRQGETFDEPEGARYITISHTLAQLMAEVLRKHD
jgi:hypothetical protein